jgi:hypothetical protein
MAKKRRKFIKPPASRPPKRLIHISVEGRITEPQYFKILEKLYPESLYRIECIKGGNDSSPKDVLKRMKRHIGQKNLEPGDEAWVVTDKDNWTIEQLTPLHEWSLRKVNYGFALSNPKFEYWLLLHFEEGDTIRSPLDCDRRLKKHLTHHGTSYDFSKITRREINDAVRRAKKRDRPPCKDWPRTIGNTTVYRLVEKFFEAKANG